MVFSQEIGVYKADGLQSLRLTSSWSIIQKMLLIYFVLTFHHHIFGHAESTALKFKSESLSSTSKERILACYYRSDLNNATLLSTDVCTHIIYAFASISQDGIVPDPKSMPSIRALAKLKDKNPKLRIIMSLNTGFSSVVSFGTEAMLRFSLSAIDFLKKFNYDGVDFDWEFPGILQKQACSEFMMILGTVLHRSNKTLSLAMPNNFHLFEQGYFVDTINKYTDFVTIMTYDFHFYTPRTNATDFNSPLYSPKGDNPLASTAGLVDLYLSLGMSPSKMLIGFPTYARTWELANASSHDVHAPAIGLGAPGPVTRERGYYMFQDICVAQKKGGTIVRDEQAGAEYMYYGKTWIAFNGMYSATIKTDWLKKKNLAGVGVWTFNYDDPHNVCGLGPFPVLRNVRSHL